MKTVLLNTVMLLATLASNAQQHRNNNGSLNSILTSKKAVTENGIDANWLSAAQQALTVQEYNFKGNRSTGFLAANRKQQLGFTVNAAGYTASPIQMAATQTATWNESITINNIHKGASAVSKGAFSVEQAQGRMAYHYAGFSVEYINNDNGLRQNFIINQQPVGNKDLQLSLHINGSLSPKVLNNALQFNNADGKSLLYYRDLRVWDANHKMLAATMQLKNNQELLITVKDSDAQYPVTIDPINQVAEWSASATGLIPTLTGSLAVDAAYGFTVAGVGDVNADGYSDVAIGAPAMVDLISGSGSLASVGAVFVYYGSQNGLSATPAAMLQPTNSIAGALFGYSIAGGDINNDGHSDIIVGAPLDNVTLSIGGGNTASGTVGKVYAFSGTTLSYSTTPMLSLQLSGTGILEDGLNLSVNALFGFSVAVTEDLNADNKRDIIVGSPAYAGIKTSILGSSIDVASGAAFIFLSRSQDNNRTIVKLNAPKSDLLGLNILSTNIGGLLFGYSVDGLGDYNGDGKADVIVGAPAGIDAGSLSGLLNGKVLQGSAIVYYGNGSGTNVNPGATLTATSGGLLTNLSGSLSNIANLFGTAVKGVRNAGGVRNGNVLVGAPLGGVLTNVLSLKLKAGTVNVFKKKSSSPSASVAPDQVITSPRNSNNILQLVQCNLLFGYSIDNTLDVNCDGIGDFIVGEPASSGAQLLNANVAGGAAYVFLGKSDGTYQATPSWTMTATTDAFLGVNASALIGFSVAGAGHVKGYANSPRVMAGSPSRTLDFGTGLLNLGNTFGTLFGLVAGNNGVGKADVFDTKFCVQAGLLPVSMSPLKAVYSNGVAHLTWSTMQEYNVSYFEMEHSTDGIHFTVIGKVTAAGYSGSTKNYFIDDTKLSGGYNHYRFRMMEGSGRYQYSNVVVVNVTLKGMNIVKVYPTPFTDKVMVDVASENSALVNIKIVDAAGKAMDNTTYNIAEGFSTITVGGLAGLSKGMYIMQITCAGKTTTQKLVKQ